jgi:hypothetical protein
MDSDSPIDYSDLPDAVRDIFKQTITQAQAIERSSLVSGIDPEVLSLDGLPYRVPAGDAKRQASVSSSLRKRRITKLLLRLQRIRMEALRLYEPMDHIDVFHRCTAIERVLRGSNRSGKTLGAAVEFARAVTGQDPYRKYPKTGGRAFIVGKDGKHNSEVLYRKLFRKNAFRIIRDQHTGRWRSWRPWKQEDADREKETKPAPPLIPPHMVREVSWENKKEQVPNVVRLTNGWEIRFYSSLGSPPQGSDVDLVWFDEEIVDPEWYSEVAVRGTVDRNGRFMWSATAQKGGEQLYDLCQLAEQQLNDPEPRVVEVFAHIDKNKHFSNRQREIFRSKLTEEQRRIRIEGEFAFTSFRVYPEYDTNIHGTDWFQIPGDWTRYYIVDPGRQVCAVLFAALAPPWEEAWKDTILLYDELYIRRASAELFADRMQHKCDGNVFHAGVIDRHGSRITESGSGRTVEAQYSEALRAAGVSTVTTGHGFVWGSDDVISGIEAFRSLLHIRPSGRPGVMVFRERLPYFEYEISRYGYQRKGEMLTDKPLQKNNHLMDCCRYLALFKPKWYPVPKGKRKKNPIVELVKERKRKAAHKAGADRITLGPIGGK